MRLVEAIFQYKIADLMKTYMKVGWFIVEIRYSIKFFSVILLFLFILYQIFGHFEILNFEFWNDHLKKP